MKDYIIEMSERNSQTSSTRQAPFEARLKKTLRLSSVPKKQKMLYSLRPGRGTVSYAESRQLQT